MSMENEHGYCPNCKADLDGEPIWEYFFKEYGSESEADRVAEMYGATREKGKFGRRIGIYDMDKDMTVAWACPDCNHQWSR